jgi:phage-related protein
MGSPAVLALKVVSDVRDGVKGVDEVTTKTSKMSKAGNVAGKVLAAGLGAAAFAAVKATKAAADDQQAQVKLATTMRNAAGASSSQVAATEKWITAQGKAKGFADDELRPALGRLVAVTHDVGKSQKLASLAMDISAGTGKSLETVSTALAKAQAGSVGGLSRLGVATKTQSGATKSLHDITKDLSKTYAGAAAKSADTAAGKQRILQVQMGELQEKIGTGLLPVMSKLAEVGLKVVDWISKNTTTAGILLGTLAGLLAIVKAVSVATQVWGAVTKIYTGVQWLLNAAMDANPIGLVVIAIVALIAIIVIAWKKSETFRKIVIGAWDAIKKATGAVWDWVKKAVSKAWDFLVNIFKRFTLVGLIVSNWGKIKKATGAVWDWIVSKVKAVWRFLVGIVQGNINRARAIITAVWTVIKNATGRAWDGILSAVGRAIAKVVSFVTGLKNKVTGIFGNAGRWLLDAGHRIIQGLLDGIRAGFDKVRQLLGKLTSFLPDWKGPAERDRSLLRRSGQLVMDGLVTGIESRHAKLRKTLQTVTAMVQDGVNPAVATPSGATAGRFTLATRSGGDSYYVDARGALDEDATASKIVTMLERHNRRRGKR